MRFIGVDLAWSARNGTGAAVIVGDERTGRLVCSAIVGDDEEVVEFVREHAGTESETALVAIDAPLRVPNQEGRRPAEAELGVMFARYHAGAHPANRRRLAVDGVVRGEALVARLDDLGFVHEPEVVALAPTRQVIEVYPHPAMVSIFGLDRVLPYKARPSRPPASRLAAFGRYHALLRSLAAAEPAVVGSLARAEPALAGADGDPLHDLLARDLSGLRGAQLKAHEDRLDGVMCAYVAHYLWRWGMARARAFGSRDAGSITTPIPASTGVCRPDSRPRAVHRPSRSPLPVAHLGHPSTPPAYNAGYRRPARRAAEVAGDEGRPRMKVTDLSITLHRWDVPRTVYSSVAGGEKHVGVVTIATDEGVDGHSFLGTSGQGADEFAPQVLQRLKPLLMGRDPLDVGAIWADMWRLNRLADLRSICAVDVALWDLMGKVAGLPIHRLIGTHRHSAPAYASSAVMTDPQEWVDEALSFKERGWQAYKIHPLGDPARDVEICRKVREAVGGDMVLMLDSMWSYGYEDAVRVGLAIQELGYFWYEDPLAEDDLYGYVKLKQKLTIPILATEYSPGGLYGYTPWITEQATDMLRGDVAVKGGLTPMIRIAHLAEGFRMKCEIHHGGNSLNNVANLHLTMAIPNCDYFEVLQPDHAQKHGLVRDIEVDAQGLVHAPMAPGLGYEIDWELIERNKVAVLR